MMEKSITSNYRVQQYSSLLVKTLSTVKQLHQHALLKYPEQQNLVNPLQALEFFSKQTSNIDVHRLATEIPSICSFSTQELLGCIIIQKKRGFIIPPQIIHLCFLLESSKNVKELEEQIVKYYKNIFQHQSQSNEAVLNESTLLNGKGLYQRYFQQKYKTSQVDASQEFKIINSQAATVIASDFITHYEIYKFNIFLTDFAGLAEKMKKDDYPLFQKQPLIKIVWGENGKDHQYLEQKYEKEINFLYFYHSKFQFQFQNESNGENNLLVMTLDYALQKVEDSQLNMLQWVNQHFKNNKIKNSNVILYCSQDDLIKQKVELKALQMMCEQLQFIGNDEKFLNDQITLMFQKNEISQFKGNKTSTLPKRNQLNKNPLILWGDTNRTQENNEYYAKLRDEFKDNTVIQIFTSQEMRRIPIDNPNSIHIVIMCGSFSQEEKNNVSNMSWCQQSILEYDLNCTHVILFTSEQTVEHRKWDNSFRKSHPNILITTSFSQLKNLIKRENFLNTI